MTEDLNEKYDLLLDDVDHTFDKDDRDEVVSQAIHDVAVIISTAEPVPMSTKVIMQHLCFLVSTVRQCDRALADVTSQTDVETLLSMVVYAKWLGKVDALIGKSHKNYSHIDWRQIWESGKSPERAVAEIVGQADEKTVRWEGL